MKLFNSLLQRQVVQSYSARRKQTHLDFTIEALKCHRDDEHKVKGIGTEVEVPPFACSFNKSLLKGHMLAVADEDGSVCLFDVRKQGSCSKLKGWVAHSNAIFDIAWTHDEPKLVTASGDQTAQLWDIQHSTRLAVFRGHSCSLKSVDFQEGNLFVFATGARDGNVMIWDIRSNKRDGYYQPVNTIRNCHSTVSSGTPQLTKKRRRRPSVIVNQDSQQSVTSVQFQDANTIISAGAVDGNIKVWDLRKNYSTIRAIPVPCQVFPYPGSGSRKHGFSSLTLDSTKSKLFANCTNDIIYMYDCISFKKTPLCCFHGHSNPTFYVKSAVSPDDQFLMSGSGDCDGYIWKISEPNAPPFHLTGHVGEVTSVAWCPQDQGKVATCSDDNNLKVWRLNFASQNDTEFVGLCERKPHRIIPSEMLDSPQSKIKTPNTSPTRSCYSSTSSSPVSLLPNQAKSSSPQQFLQSWLKSNTNKRQRENDSAANENKRCCLENSTLVKKDVQIENSLAINETADKSSCPSTSACERRISNIYQDQDNSKMLLTQERTIKIEPNKENVQANGKTESKLQPLHCMKEQHFHSGKGDSMLEKMTEQKLQKDHREHNHHSDISTNTIKTIAKKSLLKGSTSEQNCKKDKTLQQPASPMAEPCSPDDKEFSAVLKSMKCIKAYFKPLPVRDEDSLSKHCERGVDISYQRDT